MPLFLAVLLGLGVLAFQNHYRRQLWNPETLAMVNGQMIPRSAVEKVMDLANHPYLALSSQEPGQVTVHQILDRLIDEELVRQAAQEEGVTVSAEQIEAHLDLYYKSWGCDSSGTSSLCRAPKGQSLASLKQAIEKQILLNVMIHKVAVLYSHPTKEGWRVFWANWLRKFPLAKVFRVRILLVQEDEAVESLLKPTKKTRSLSDIAQSITEKGFAALVTPPMYLNPFDPETFYLFRKSNLGPELLKAAKQPSRQTGPIKLRENLAIFEVIEYFEPLDPESYAISARKAYERQESEKAFRIWLSDLRQKAEIVLNPTFLEQAGTQDGTNFKQ
jgi:hypothetical protein